MKFLAKPLDRMQGNGSMVRVSLFSAAEERAQPFFQYIVCGLQFVVDDSSVNDSIAKPILSNKFFMSAPMK